VVGTTTTLDLSNIRASGQDPSGAHTLAHELWHVVAALNASDFPQAQAAMSQQDQPSAPGRNDTTGGSAELVATIVSDQIAGQEVTTQDLANTLNFIILGQVLATSRDDLSQQQPATEPTSNTSDATSAKTQ
jgi:hypothetical protein